MASVDDVVAQQRQQQQDLQEPLLLPSSNNHHEEEEQLEAAAAASGEVVVDDAAAGGGSGSNSTIDTKPSRRNIRLTLWYMLFRCGGEAIWYYSVLSSYVYLIQPQHPALVGYLSAIEGVVQFVAALVAGVLADQFYTTGKRRTLLLQVSSVIGVCACAMTLVASGAWEDDDNNDDESSGTDGGRRGLGHVLCLALAMMLWGIFDGICLTVSMALFADSMQQGDRSYYFTQRTTCTTLGSVFGPICGIVMFYMLGDAWTVADCAVVIRLAQVFLIPAFVMLCCFRDTAKVSAEAVPVESAAPSMVALEHEDQDINGTAQQLLLQRQQEQQATMQNVEEPAPTCTTTATTSSSSSSSTGQDASSILSRNDTAQQQQQSLYSKSRYIAILTAGSDILCAFASGIAFRYYTIFFVTRLKLDPVLVQGIDATSCLAGIAVLQLTQRLSLRFGRCATAIVFKWTGVLWLLLMTVGYQHGFLRQWWLVVILYLCQSAFLSSTGALTRSLVMDNVPSEERAKWSALESINIFGWCGTAAVGGYLVERFHGNVLPVFYISAMLQVVGSLPLVLLIRVETLERRE